VTEVSSKGLIPQLSEVLQALTQSHELLLGKVQQTRLEHTRAVRTDIRAGRDGARAFTITPTTSVAGTRPFAPPTDAGGSSRARPSRPSFDAAGGIAVTPQDWSPTPETEPRAEDGAPELYNYFDELDAKLAQIEQPERDPGDR
jgi:hypothetical protein